MTPASIRAALEGLKQPHTFDRDGDVLCPAHDGGACIEECGAAWQHRQVDAILSNFDRMIEAVRCDDRTAIREAVAVRCTPADPQALSDRRLSEVHAVAPIHSDLRAFLRELIVRREIERNG